MNELKVYETQSELTIQDLNQDLAASWIKYLDVKPKTAETYTRNIRPLFKYLQENGIAQPTREDILAFRDSLRETCKPATIQSYLAATRLFFQWTEQAKLYPNIATHIKGAKLTNEHRKDYLTSKQAANVLKTIDTSTLKGKRNYAIIALMLTSGLRTIEVSRANIADLRTAGDSSVLYIQGKGHDEKDQYVKIAEPVEAAIREYFKARGSIAASEPLFVSTSNRNHNGRLTAHAIGLLSKAALKAAGYDSDRLTAHSLRHTAATLNLLNGGSLEETRQLLRHSSINTTLIYSHALERANNNSEIRVAKAIFG